VLLGLLADAVGSTALPELATIARLRRSEALTRGSFELQECLRAGLRLRGDCLSLQRGLCVPAPSYKSDFASESCEMVVEGLGVREAWHTGIRWGVGEDTAAGVSSPASRLRPPHIPQTGLLAESGQCRTRAHRHETC
jgi:hypothetical protein